MGRTEHGECPDGVEQGSHATENVYRPFPVDDRLARIAAGQAQFAQAEQRPRLSQPIARGTRQLQGALQHLAGRSELTPPRLRDADAHQGICLSDGIIEVTGGRQGQFEGHDGLGQISGP